MENKKKVIGYISEKIRLQTGRHGVALYLKLGKV